MVKTQATCNVCIDSRTGELCRCDHRKVCPDDASTIKKRKEILFELPRINANGMEEKN